MVHAIVCNERKTDDGVIAGGERLVEEMLQVMRDTMASNKRGSSVSKDVTISMIQSLGSIQYESLERGLAHVLGKGLAIEYDRLGC